MKFIFGDRTTLTDKTKYIGYNFYVIINVFGFLDEKYIIWCKDNYDNDDWCHRDNGSIWFRTIEDLIAFKLRWL